MPFHFISLDHPYMNTYFEKTLLCLYLPGPNVDYHVMLVANGDNVLGAGRESHACHSIFMLLKFSHLSSFSNIPYANGRHVPTLEKERATAMNASLVKISYNKSIDAQT